MKDTEMELQMPVSNSCGPASVRAKGHDYQVDEIADWHFIEYGAVRAKGHGMFTTDALLALSEQMLLERD